MKAKQRVPALRGGQPGDLASNRGSCDRISLQRASMRRKITLNNPGIWGMSGYEASPAPGGRGVCDAKNKPLVPEKRLGPGSTSRANVVKLVNFDPKSGS
jgi:hypothetical protein